MRKLIVLAYLVLLGGCSVQSSQLSAVMSYIKAPSNNISLNSWSVKYANYESIVYPVALSEGILFSNSTGDQLLFDGWSIRRVGGLGFYGSTIHISDIDGERSFTREGRSYVVHRCDQWMKKQQYGKKQFIQSCKGVRVYSNSILVDQDGSIVVIKQIIDDRYEPLILTKLN